MQDFSSKLLGWWKSKGPTSSSVWHSIFQRIKLAIVDFEHFITHSKSGDKESTAQLQSKYYSLLSMVEDACDLSRPGSPSKRILYATNLQQVTQDFAEGYAQRFGVTQAKNLVFLTSHILPIVRTSPRELIRIMECFARSAYQKDSNQCVEFRLETASEQTSENSHTIRFFYKCQTLIQLRDTLSKLFDKLNQGQEELGVEHLDLELAAGLQIARRLGAKFYLENQSDSGTAIEARFDFVQASKHYPMPIRAQDFAFYTQSQEIADLLTTVASFHGIKARALKTLDTYDNSLPLIVDIIDMDQVDAKKFLPRLAEHCVLISRSVTDETKIAGLLQSPPIFARLPLISSHLLRQITTPTVPNVERSAQPPLHISKLRVLVVDDVPTARILLSDYFKSDGHTVVEADDGTNFVSLIESGEVFDIVFCDSEMLYLDGAAAVEKVRLYEKKLGRHTPVVLTSAYVASEYPKESIGVLFDYVLPKPINFNKVREILEELFSKDRVEVVPPQTKSPQTSFEIIDVADLLKRCGERKSTAVKVLEAYSATSLQCLASFMNQEVLNDVAALGKAAHKIKGLLRDVGAVEHAKTMEDIEKQILIAKAANIEQISQVESLVKSTLEQAKNIAQQMSKEL